MTRPTGLLLALVGVATAAPAQEVTPSVAERSTLSRARGSESAALFVYEFSDFQCPHCARFSIDVFPRIDSAFVRTGRVRWIFVHLPQPTHENAWAAHETAACAGGVANRFWELHDRLFRDQAEWVGRANPASVLARFAREAGVPTEPFQACIEEDETANVILGDVIFAATSGVSGTPAFNVNNEMTVMGLKTFEEWKELLEKALRKDAPEARKPQPSRSPGST